MKHLTIPVLLAGRLIALSTMLAAWDTSES
jgi:hypothetical protein